MNQDGSVNSAANPARPGSIVSIWATGTGAEGPDGVQANQAAATCQCEITDRLNSAKVTYAGYSPGLVDGVTQINFQIPASPEAGSAEYFYMVAGAGTSSQTFVFVSQ